MQTIVDYNNDNVVAISLFQQNRHHAITSSHIIAGSRRRANKTPFNVVMRSKSLYVVALRQRYKI